MVYIENSFSMNVYAINYTQKEFYSLNRTIKSQNTCHINRWMTKKNHSIVIHSLLVKSRQSNLISRNQHSRLVCNSERVNKIL